MKSQTRVRRLPFAIEKTICHPDFYEVTIVSYTLGPSVAKGEMFGTGLPEDFIEFFKQHGSCVYCSALISADFGRCRCGKPEGEPEYLEIKYSASLKPLVDTLYARERARVRHVKRSLMVLENGGKFDRKHISGMHAAQLGVCFFCGTQISLGSKSLHVDHYKPLSEGGRNDLANMVLTCAKCNFLKNAMDGERFDAKVRRHRTPEQSAIVKAARRSLRAYKKAATDH